MTLEEKIKQMLEAKLQVAEATVEEASCSKEMEKEEGETEVKVNPKKKEKTTAVKEETEVAAEEAVEEVVAEEVVEEQKKSVSEQVSALLSVEGLSEDFRTQAVAIFEAAVADRTMQIEEEQKQKFDEQFEQAKVDLVENIDGYMTAAVVKWIEENQVALVHSFKADLAESFIDGLRSLFVEHNVAVPEEGEDALNIAVSEVEKLEAQLAEQKQTELKLVEELNEVKRVQVLESFKTKMTNTQADRFIKLVDAIKFESVEQYTKQLEIVQENFSTKAAAEAEQIVESVKAPVSAPANSIAAYAEFFKKTSK